ncbi:hypothetical protein RCH09_003075, partial [Actimicrobium sp. GrIS 1.19]|nr:hypothetical protein [Actimicrobium sp. GrIS 1.19]
STPFATQFRTVPRNKTRQQTDQHHNLFLPAF